MSTKPPNIDIEAIRGIPPDIDGLHLQDPRDLTASARLQEIGIRVQEENHRRQRWETHLRASLTIAIMLMFLLINVCVGLLVYTTSQAELELLRAKLMSPADRTVTPGVFMALIAASVAQVGAGIATILTYLFPRSSLRDGGKDGMQAVAGSNPDVRPTKSMG